MAIGARIVVNKARTDVPPTALDGKTGAFVANECFFVTLPTSEKIYQPLLDQRELYLRSDYHFGPEDPLLYPQPFLPSRCHHAAIPRQPLDASDPLAKWWESLPFEVFRLETGGAVKGLSKWKRDSLGSYQQDLDSISRRVETYRGERETLGREPNGLVTALDQQLRRSLSHLTSLLLPFHRAVRRWYLELLRALDWVEFYKPVMDAVSWSSPHSREKASKAMGAFLHHVHDCEFFFSVGLPFWYIRPTSDHINARIDCEGLLCTPATEAIVQDGFPSHPRVIIYTGTLANVKRVAAIEKWAYSMVDSGNPFDYTSTNPDGLPEASSSSSASSSPLAGPSSVPDPASSVGASRSSKGKGKGKGSKPYDGSKHQKGPQPPQRDKFAEIPGDCTLAVLEVWTNAVKSIDQSRHPAKGTVKNAGYAFPDPGMILFAPPEQRAKMMKTWLRFRSALTFWHMMDPPCLASSAWSSHQ
ncbi:hypothetical protein V5O48_003633 [Marasmius crinis-equi]|uniref:Uncharacterized protein n=1 Tax=Marasmius crinis-equi TaxID=585013 RepID=A0ABR3FSB8_9AGAR